MSVKSTSEQVIMCTVWQTSDSTVAICHLEFEICCNEMRYIFLRNLGTGLGSFNM